MSGDQATFDPQLLDDYVAITRKRPTGALAATALRTGSLAARHLLARTAVGSAAGLEELIDVARRHRPRSVRLDGGDPRLLCDLAQVVALQRILPDDVSDGLALYELALDTFGPTRIPARHQGIHAQLAYMSGDPQRAAALCETYARIPDEVLRHLELDLANPFVAPADAGTGGKSRPGQAHWLREFQRLLPAPAPVLLTNPDLSPFDRLTTPPLPTIAADEKVSVIVTSFQPDRSLLTSIQSLTSQTWKNIEIIIIDDASPPAHDPILEECLASDERVRLIKQTTNQGTYLARNVGLDAATGLFVTFHDSDDWSHPARLAVQGARLLADPDIVATVSEGLAVTRDLVVTRPGRRSGVLYNSSMMFRRSPVVEKVGYFDHARKAADTEYLHRIEAAFGEKRVLRMLGEFYTLIQQTPGSLSRADFRPGWTHPARTAYRSAYRIWHERIASGDADPYLPSEAHRRRFWAPHHLLRAPDEPPQTMHYDVVLAGDWRRLGGPQKSMIEEIQALTKRGMRVGVMHLEAYRFMTRHRQPLCRRVQELINDGTVGHVLPGEPTEVTLLIIRYPPVLQFSPSEPARMRAKRVVILANQAPHERDGTDIRYRPTDCEATAKYMFNADPVWWPQGPMVREELENYRDDLVMSEFDIPGIIDQTQWNTLRDEFRSDLPVIGRHSRDNWTKWPDDRETLLRVYPESDSVDVRIMGGSQALVKVLESDTLPPNWLVYEYDEVSIREFLAQIDFYVYFPHSTMIEAFGRAILEALATGCVVVLPHHFAQTFGDAAIYCAPDQAWPTVERYFSQPELYFDQSRRAQDRVREFFSHDSYATRVAEEISTT